MSDNEADEIHKLKIICSKCKQHFSATPTPAEWYNNLRSSVIVFTHNALTKCPKCHQPFLLLMNGVFSFDIIAQPVDDDVVEQMEGSRLVKPALSLIN